MKLNTFALAVLLLMADAVWAQPIGTFEQVLQSVLDSHPAIIGKHSALAAARADQKGAEWLRYPTPSVEAATRSNGKDAGLLRIEQPLWSSGRITSAIDAAGSRLDAAGASLNETKLELTLKVIAAYTEALRQKARRQHAIASVDEHEKLLGMIRRRVAQEVSPLADQRLAESRYYQSTNDLSQASQAFNSALVQLAQLSGMQLADISDHGVGTAVAPASREIALSQALAYSATLRRLAYEEEAANAEIEAKRSVYMPQLSLRLERNVGQMQSDSSAMLVLTAQPGAGLSARAGVDAAIARREAIHMAHQEAERSINERIMLDWNEWEAARQRQENANQSRIMATEVFESYTRQYVIGRKSWLDVLNAVREATLSQYTVEDARSQAIAASLRLRAQTGTLNLEALHQKSE